MPDEENLSERGQSRPMHEGESFNKGYKTTAPKDEAPPDPTGAPKSPLDEKK